jgi:zinc protease
MSATLIPGAWTAGVQREVLPNGLRVLVQRDHSAPVVAIVTHVEAGFFDEPDEWVGISHVLEHMFFKGTPSRGVGEVARQTKSAGGYLNAGTSYDYTIYYTVLPARSFETGLDVQSDALQHVLLDEGELTRELRVIIEEAKRKLDTPAAVAREKLHALMYDRHRIRRWRIGTENQLSRLTRDDLWRYYTSRYVPARTTVSIVGDVDESVALRMARERYGDWPAAKVDIASSPEEPPHTGLRLDTLRGDVTLAHLLCGWPGVPPLDPAAAALEVAAAVLSTGRGSWLYRVLRERGLVTSVAASHFAPTELGMFTIGAELRAERIPETLEHIAQAVFRLRERGPGAEDLERARRLLMMQWARGLEPMEGRAAAVAAAEALRDVPLLDEQYEQLTRVTADQVRDAVAQYLVPSHLAVLTHVPRETKSDLVRDEVEAVFSQETVTPLSNPSPTELEAPMSVMVQAEERHAVHHAALPGVDLLVRRKAGVPVATVGLFAPRGGFDPPTQAGMGALALRSALRGAGGMDASGLAFAFEQLGGALVPRTASDWLGFDTSVLVEHLVPAAVLLQEVMVSPAFAPQAVEEERTVLLAEARQVADDMFRFPFQLAFRGAFADRGYGLPTLGLPSTIEALEGADVSSWHAEWLAGTRLTAVAVGDFEPSQALEGLAGVFGGWPSATRLAGGSEERWAIEGGAVEREAERDKAQSALAFVFPGPTRRDARRYEAEVWAAVASGLGGRLFDALRERRSLAYTVLATHWQRRDAGALATYIATSPDREQEARSAMLEELEVFRREAVGERELRQAVNYLVGQAEVRRQIGAQVLAEIREAWLLGAGLAELEDPGAHYRRVSAEQVQDLARTCLDPDRLAIGVVRGVGSA